MTEVTLDVLAERLNNFDKNNSDSHQALKAQIQAFVVENRVLMDEQSNKISHNDDRIKTLEFWKVGFVAKFSAYSAVALFVGSFAAQLVLKYADKFIK